MTDAEHLKLVREAARTAVHYVEYEGWFPNDDGFEVPDACADAVLDALTAAGWRPPTADPTTPTIRTLLGFQQRAAAALTELAALTTAMADTMATLDPATTGPDWSHEIAFDDDGTWTIGHPDGCPGQAGGDCDVARNASAWVSTGALDGLRGHRYECAVNDIGDRLLLGDRITTDTDQITAERDSLVETIGRLVNLPPEAIARMYSVGYSGTSTATTLAQTAAEALGVHVPTELAAAPTRPTPPPSDLDAIPAAAANTATAAHNLREQLDRVTLGRQQLQDELDELRHRLDALQPLITTAQAWRTHPTSPQAMALMRAIDTLPPPALDTTGRAATLAQIRTEADQLDDDLAAGRIADRLGDPAPVDPTRHPGDTLVDALRSAYTAEELDMLHDEIVDLIDDDAPRDYPMGRLVDALHVAAHPRPVPASVPSARAQGDVFARLGRAVARVMEPYAEQLRRMTVPPAQEYDVDGLLANVTRSLNSARDDDERAEAIEMLLAGWYAAWPEDAVTDPHAPLASELVRLLGSPRPAQEEPIRPAAWEQQAHAAAREALVEHWGYEIGGELTPAQMAVDVVRAIIDAGLAGAGPVERAEG